MEIGKIAYSGELFYGNDHIKYDHIHGKGAVATSIPMK